MSSLIKKKNTALSEAADDLRKLHRAIKNDEPIVVQTLKQRNGKPVLRKRIITGRELNGKAGSEVILPKFSGEEIKKLRLSLGLSQAAFARWLSSGPGTVRQWEQTTGVKAGPSLRILHLLKSDLKYWRNVIHRELLVGGAMDPISS